MVPNFLRVPYVVNLILAKLLAGNPNNAALIDPISVSDTVDKSLPYAL